MMMVKKQQAHLILKIHKTQRNRETRNKFIIMPFAEKEEYNQQKKPSLYSYFFSEFRYWQKDHGPKKRWKKYANKTHNTKFSAGKEESRKIKMKKMHNIMLNKIIRPSIS
jgi:hypothetical protein